MSLHLIFQSLLIHHPRHTVCDLVRPCRNRAAGRIANKLNPPRTASHQQNVFLPCPHAHPPLKVDGFQNTPDAIIRSPPANAWKCTSTSIFAAGLASRLCCYTLPFGPRVLFSVSFSTCFPCPLSPHVFTYLLIFLSPFPSTRLRFERPRRHRTAERGGDNKRKPPRSANRQQKLFSPYPPARPPLKVFEWFQHAPDARIRMPPPKLGSVLARPSSRRACPRISVATHYLSILARPPPQSHGGWVLNNLRLQDRSAIKKGRLVVSTSTPTS